MEAETGTDPLFNNPIGDCRMSDFDDLMNETPDPIIPLGKHQGNYASDIDVEYLDWLIGQTWLSPELKNEILAHLKTRAERM